MPDPNLYYIQAFGHGGPATAPMFHWEWACTHHVLVTPAFPDVSSSLTVLRAWWFSAVGMMSPVAGVVWAWDTWFTHFIVTHPATGTTSHFAPFILSLGSGRGVTDFALPQVSLLTWANAAALGTASRLYLPGQPVVDMQHSPPRWSTVKYSPLLASLWLPRTIAFREIRPVIYAAAADTVHLVDSAYYTVWPRTQRRRSLSLGVNTVRIV